MSASSSQFVLILIASNRSRRGGVPGGGFIRLHVTHLARRSRVTSEGGVYGLRLCLRPLPYDCTWLMLMLMLMFMFIIISIINSNANITIVMIDLIFMLSVLKP
ncbi:unnamed protein product [Phytomonas sp. EM1]|nr:unnamed protein product [Phytomonas sp. EM1]|eukprot:CCW63974.1 unnamed protein product [Phytomonas sp. isolate EM1]